MNTILTTIEIALFIVLPLILFYQRSKWSYKSYTIHIVLLYFIWYFTYALFHELSHMLGVWITHAEMIDYQLIPHFWKGDFKTGYIRTNYDNSSQEFFIVVLAYVRDILFLAIGYMILRKKTIKSSFFIGLILILFVLSPLFDIMNNYSGFLIGALNDFNALKNTSSSFLANAIGSVFTLFALLVLWKIFLDYKDFPELDVKKN